MEELILNNDFNYKNNILNKVSDNKSRFSSSYVESKNLSQTKFDQIFNNTLNRTQPDMKKGNNIVNNSNNDEIDHCKDSKQFDQMEDNFDSIKITAKEKNVELDKFEKESVENLEEENGFSQISMDQNDYDLSIFEDLIKKSETLTSNITFDKRESSQFIDEHIEFDSKENIVRADKKKVNSPIENKFLIVKQTNQGDMEFKSNEIGFDNDSIIENPEEISQRGDNSIVVDVESENDVKKESVLKRINEVELKLESKGVDVKVLNLERLDLNSMGSDVKNGDREFSFESNSSYQEHSLKNVSIDNVNSFVKELESKLEKEESKVMNSEIKKDNVLNQINSKLAQVKDFGKVNIILRPENLGRLQIELKQMKEVLVANLVASNNSVKEILDNSSDNLKKALNAQGIQVESINIKVESNSESSSSNGRQPNWSGDTSNLLRENNDSNMFRNRNSNENELDLRRYNSEFRNKDRIGEIREEDVEEKRQENIDERLRQIDIKV